MYKNITTTDFFNSAYVNYASYDNVRKIASIADGQKNAARKILWYVLTKNQKSEIKTSQLDSKVAEAMEYLHGSMAGVIVNLAQNYTGTNNINMLHPEGNFGTRLVPEASAPRYIYTYGSDMFFKMFNKEDNPILEHQEFEGTKIEPKFMLPVLPLLLVNGAEGISSGFAQKILPRNPESIMKYIMYYLEKPDAVKKPFRNIPYFEGFRGTVIQGEYPDQWIIQGAFTRKANKVYITELPIGYSLKSYLKILNKLLDDKKIINYKDYSDEDFNFEVQFNRKYLDSLSDDKLYDLLKLRKKVTENYTVMNIDNTIKVYNNIDEIMQDFIKIKKEYIKRRKLYQIDNITQEIKTLISKYIFIKNIVDETLSINKRKEQDIIKDLDRIDKIIKVDDSYDYLFRMSIQSLTEERMQKLMQEIKNKKVHLDEIKNSTIETLWLKDIKTLKD